MPHRPVRKGAKRSRPQFVEAVLDRGDAGLDVDAQFGQHVGRAALAGEFAVAVLGDRLAGGRGDQGRRRADVERAGGVAASAYHVDDVLASGPDAGHVAAWRRPRRPLRRPSRPSHAVRRAARQSPPLGRRRHDPADRLVHLLHGKMFAAADSRFTIVSIIRISSLRRRGKNPGMPF